MRTQDTGSRTWDPGPETKNPGPKNKDPRLQDPQRRILKLDIDPGTPGAIPIT